MTGILASCSVPKHNDIIAWEKLRAYNVHIVKKAIELHTIGQTARVKKKRYNRAKAKQETW